MTFLNVGPVKACFSIVTDNTQDAAAVAKFIRTLKLARQSAFGGSSLQHSQGFEVTFNGASVAVVFDPDVSPVEVELAHSQVLSRLNEWVATTVKTMGMGVMIHVPASVETRLTWNGRVPEMSGP